MKCNVNIFAKTQGKAEHLLFVDSEKKYTLLGRDGKAFKSRDKGALGGYSRGSVRIYGRLNCQSALAWIARGHYAPYRVFFPDEDTAIAAGFRPCGKCMPEKYRIWKTGRTR